MLLEMTGFGSFREPATVDFTDADFFALIGPTGAGKSTVIDAMIFALYGSVPRWDDRRTVSLALSPTVNRGVVRLVFDVGASRYIAVRELRRTKMSVGIHNGRLERLIDPTRLGSTDDETELIAADGKVNAAVEKLLGLSFDHFCSCVVLPQGDFAEFLHDKPADRQKLLTRLLGIGLYETIGQRANAEAAEAKQRVAFLDEQIGSLATVTPEAVGEANLRVQQLTVLTDQVVTVLSELVAATAAVDKAQRNTDRIREETQLLGGVALPSDLDTRAERQAEATGAAEQATKAFATAEKADDIARSTFETAAANRGSLEHAKRNHAERSHLEQQLPDAGNDRAGAAKTLAAVTAERDLAMQTAAAAQAASEAAKAAAKAARERVETVRSQHEKLSRLSVPSGISGIQEREVSAKEALTAAGRRLAEAEEAESDARRDVEAAPSRSALNKAKNHHAELTKLAAAEPDLINRADRARAEFISTQVALDEAIRAVDQARLARNEAGRAEAASVLRPHLVAGEPCPVCEHPVKELPELLEHEAVAATEKALATAERHRDTAARHHAVAVAQQQKAKDVLAAARQSTAELRGALTGEWADESAVDDELSRLDGLNARLKNTGVALREARAAHEAAGNAVAALAKTHAEARTALTAARDPLVSLGAPSLDGLDLAEAWHTLASWSGKTAEANAKLLDHADADARKADAESSSMAARLKHAHGEVERLGAARVAAERSDREAELALRTKNDRLRNLAEALAAAPSIVEVAVELARIDQLEAEAKLAQRELKKARAGRDSAVQALASLRAQEQTAWKELRAARDLLVPLGAPPLREEGLRAAWAELVSWVKQEVGSREVAFATARAVLSEAEHHRSEKQLALALALEQADIAISPASTADTVSAAVAAELERARAHVQSLEAQLSQLADLRSSRAKSNEQHAVASMLGGLLRSNEFPRWLVASALDVLVQDASATLAELSGGQFNLAHDDGEFLVIDHNNADLPRPVKTLSGGETFQASLALALALSAQITTLAAAGSARLDSIFLDEGFGTLDEETLETVANTLENLASQGNRMVGVISHVSALADRVPLKFRVSRDQFGSAIMKVNL
ncbi:AAA family ATPase [Micromonospora noduli]|uniref:AAA family ATPase n=1 Tax=Micromonospora noduli TaxID=709876 RepID=UPI0015EB80EF|nr:SMC family ATPase [Micromonospora noduli]